MSKMELLDKVTATARYLDHAVFAPLQEQYNLLPAQIKIMLHLAQNPDIKISDLASVVGCTQAYLTSLVDGLEELGLVARYQIKTDRRRVFVHLTAEVGDVKVKEIRKAFDKQIDNVFAGFTDGDIVALNVICDRLSNTQEPAAVVE